MHVSAYEPEEHHSGGIYMKKRALLCALCVILACALLPISVYAEGHIIFTQQPQSGRYPENATAVWTVGAQGTNLSYTWFICYHGVGYAVQDAYAENHPWLEGVIGDGYGVNETGDTFFINGIGKALDGAEVYCVVSDGVYSETSAIAQISVGGEKIPPKIVVPSSVEIEQNKILKLSCKATAADGDNILSYLWYETSTGEMKDIIAIGLYEGYEETNPILVCDTSEIGTRYYVCAVETEQGGFAYSSVIPVTVRAKQQPPAPTEGTPDTPVTTETPPTQKETEKATTKASEPTEPSEISEPTEATEHSDAPIAIAPAPSNFKETDGAGEDLSVSDATMNDWEFLNAKQNSGLSTKSIVLLAVAALTVVAGVVASILVVKKMKK